MLNLFHAERVFDSFFGSTTGFVASGLGVAVGDGDGDGSRVGLGLALTSAASTGAMVLRDRIVSVIPTSSKATTATAIILRCFFDLSDPLSETETLGK